MTKQIEKQIPDLEKQIILLDIKNQGFISMMIKKTILLKQNFDFKKY
jgi:hypothetical protein